MNGPDDLLTLQEAADQLKVHYMTAYRWVRRGDLLAFKAGGRLRVRSEDVTAFLTAREVDVALPAGEGRRTDWPTHVDRLTVLLLGGEGVEAGSLVRKVVADGAPAGEAYVELIAPALHRVGEAWANGEIGVAVEHRATEIARGLMIRLGDAFRRRGRSRGTAVTATPAGELHGLASAMAADFLRASGFEVHHLGADIGADDLRLFLQVTDTDVVALSVTRPDTDPAVLARTVEAGRECGAVVVVGGQGAQRTVVESAGGVMVDDLARLPEQLDALVSGASP